jgi:hypothetical protein
LQHRKSRESEGGKNKNKKTVIAKLIIQKKIAQVNPKTKHNKSTRFRNHKKV